MISLSGHPWPQWNKTREKTSARWHDKSCPSATRYLGFPIYCNKKQLKSFWDEKIIKIERHCSILRERNLTIRGTSLLCNSVILSTLWHILRITPISESWLRPLRSIV
ncbi:hypothetical protein DM01DRAFT_1307528, partial [Hesseltinella vesiculosa]